MSVRAWACVCFYVGLQGGCLDWCCGFFPCFVSIICKGGVLGVFLNCAEVGEGVWEFFLFDGGWARSGSTVKTWLCAGTGREGVNIKRIVMSIQADWYGGCVVSVKEERTIIETAKLKLK